MDYIKKNPTLDELVYLASQGFCKPVTEALVQDVSQHLADTDFCLCVEDQGKLVGCMLCKIPLSGVLYIAGTLILPEYQGERIKAQATLFLLREHPELKWFSGRTQSPIVWSSVRSIAREMLPYPDIREVSQEAFNHLQQLVNALGMSAPIQQGFYGGSLYGKKPLNRDPNIQTWWDGLCDFERGDAVLYIARLN
ncbi:hypothetical protein HYV70_05250 [Candidatus Uhrbacteria bacterium]|nr:hypothetical protein [Candidatus Uhrbacteria bacterium]